MITGLIKADKGRIQFDGHEITHLPMYQRASRHRLLAAGGPIFRGLNVEDNIRAVLEWSSRARRARAGARQAARRVQHHAPAQDALDRALRRRAPHRDCARARDAPGLQLLDEPFAGIDPIAVGDIQQLVRHLTERGIGVLITDHNARDALPLTAPTSSIWRGAAEAAPTTSSTTRKSAGCIWESRTM
jgi:lipopolysaccharide export system ATP-binding protein